MPLMSKCFFFSFFLLKRPLYSILVTSIAVSEQPEVAEPLTFYPNFCCLLTQFIFRWLWLFMFSPKQDFLFCIIFVTFSSGVHQLSLYSTPVAPRANDWWLKMALHNLHEHSPLTQLSWTMAFHIIRSHIPSHPPSCWAGSEVCVDAHVTSSPRNLRARMRRKAATMRPATTSTNTCSADPSVSGVCDHDSSELWNIKVFHTC